MDEKLVPMCVSIAREQGAAAAVDALRDHPPLEAVAVLDSVIRHTYWQEKDLLLTLALGQAAVRFALDRAATSADTATVERLQDGARVMAYNLASFGWSGWDEPGVVVDAAATEVALEMAQLSLQLVGDLKLGDRALGRGQWMLGAVLLSRPDRAAARAAFATAAHHAEQANHEPERRLAETYAALVDLLDAPHDPAASRTLNDARARLREVENGEEYLKQIDTARRVYQR